MTTQDTTPTEPTIAQIVNAINNLQAQITFLYKHLGIIGTTGDPKQFAGDARRGETGMGAILNTNSDFL